MRKLALAVALAISWASAAEPPLLAREVMSTCLDRHAQIADVVSCIRPSVERNMVVGNMAIPSQFLSYADDITNDVKNGRSTETKARSSLFALYSSMVDAQRARLGDAERAAQRRAGARDAPINDAIDRAFSDYLEAVKRNAPPPRPPSYTCYRLGNMTQCDPN